MMSFNVIKKSTRITHVGLFALSLVFTTPHVLAETHASIDTAIVAATKWANLADATQPERMWNASGPIMQKNVSKADWATYLTKVQSEVGRNKDRAWAQVIRINNPENLPAGEYINVSFASGFTKSPTIEKVSLVQNAGQWIPVGYVVTRIVPPALTAAPAAAAKALSK